MSMSVRSRRAHQPDPVRLPLPGQDPTREAELRARVTAHFKPVGLTEEMWVEDIAWSMAKIEYIRALIAAYKKRCIVRAAETRQHRAPAMRIGADDDHAPALGRPMDEPYLDWMRHVGYSPDAGRSFLGNANFAILLGDFNAREQQQMRELQIMEQEEVRERDRIINQLDRARRRDLAEAIAVLEAQGWVHPDRARTTAAQAVCEDLIAETETEC